MSERVSIKPELLQWAQERAGATEEELLDRFPRYGEWLSGESAPTLKQLEQFAARTYAPLGYFFLEHPPEERLPIPDFRTTSDRPVRRPSPHLLDTIYSAQARQEWMRSFLIEQGEPPLAFVGSKSLADRPEDVAAEMRRVMGLPQGWSRGMTSWEAALRFLIASIEDAGVLVMINGVVENNTRRPLQVDEFRGFALTDRHAPLVFVNGSDAKAAQMFTLAHELAHLWIGQPGVSEIPGLLPSENEVEIFCNKVAAEFLVPAEEMQAVWRDAKAATKPFEFIARSFRVSPIVAARRALDLALISRGDYFSFYREYQQEAEDRRARTPSGGNFYLTLAVRLGKRFLGAVYSAAKQGRLPYREAYQLTGLNGATFDRFGRELGFAG
jgi:Zn-dependent peptidase ImmA (M78 family)